MYEFETEVRTIALLSEKIQRQTKLNKLLKNLAKHEFITAGVLSLTKKYISL